MTDNGIVMIRNIAGPPAIANDFFGRAAEQQAIWRHLADNSVLLIAPRRVGKTSFLHSLEAKAEAEHFRTIYLSVADAEDELGFVEQLYGAVADHEEDLVRDVLRGPLAALVKHVRSVAAYGVSVQFTDGAEGDWRALASALAARLNTSESRWLLMIDELPLFVRTLLRCDPSHQRARQFLNWFRKLRSNVRVQLNVRWLLAGSIGLDTITSGNELGDTINDLYPVSLGAFSIEEARRFIMALAENRLRLEPGTVDRLLDVIGWPIPYYLQVFFAKLCEHCKTVGVDSPGPDVVDTVFDLLLTPAYSTYFNWWEQRLERDLARDEAKAAFSVLRATAESSDGVDAASIDALICRALRSETGYRPVRLRDLLEREGYIVREGEVYRFRSNIVREYWRHRVLGK